MLIVGGVIVTESGHSTTSDVAVTAAAAVAPTTMAKWAKSNGDAFGDLAVEFRAAGDASASNDYAGIRSACRDLDDIQRMEVAADPYPDRCLTV